ncbi:MAG TPA: hypothetical protein VFW25_00260 [Silvibacterium sp.]|nr:hypothetical protein [Silvibacterium sp.]
MGISIASVGAGVVLFSAPLLAAQQTPIAYVPTTGVTVSGSLSVENGRAAIGNNGAITAVDSTAQVRLARGGELRVCASTKVNLSRDTSVAEAADSALMIALDRGALEASYEPGKFSDVLLTPDLRILISGPGTADLKIRVNVKGDTCVDNHGANAPYVTVTSQFEGGVYRVQANQRVMFEGGSLQKVVDNETEPCGCPAVAPPIAVASAASGAETTHAPMPGNIAAEAANPFPLAQSEGLASGPAAPVKPVVPVGVAHSEVEAPIAYDAGATPNPAAKGAAGKEPVSVAAAKTPASVETDSQAVNAEIAPVQPLHAPKSHRGFFHSIGHFFAKVFGP